MLREEVAAAAAAAEHRTVADGAGSKEVRQGLRLGQSTCREEAETQVALQLRSSWSYRAAADRGEGPTAPFLEAAAATEPSFREAEELRSGTRGTAAVAVVQWEPFLEAAMAEEEAVDVPSSSFPAAAVEEAGLHSVSPASDLTFPLNVR